MTVKRFAFVLSVLFLFCLASSVSLSLVCAQSSSSNNNNNNNNNDDDDNAAFNSYSGVRIDANGVLLRDPMLDFGRVSQQQIAAAKASHARHLAPNLKKQSPIRYVSLNRLEQKIRANNGVVTEEMQYLAGLQRIQYVFYFPESKDIVVAGPAEGWYPGYEGAMLGMSTGRPVCELQDLVVALRAYAPGREGASVVGCSIDPTEEGNARMQQFIKSFGSYGGQERYEAFVRGLRSSLGMQTVRVDGIPANTHAAVVMVAADYRMKRIGIGVEESPTPITTFISKVKPGSSNALYRWFFVPDYQSVIMTEDKTGMELVGEGVKLVAEDELVDTVTGQRTAQKGKIDAASRAFSSSFTQEYPKLARKSLVFAQLRNFIDMLVCAAHIQQQDFYGKAGWSMELLGDEGQYAVRTSTAPSQVEPVVGMKVRGGKAMFPIGGGVEIEASLALKEGNVKLEENSQISSVQNNIKIELQAGQWWWD